MCKKSLIAIFPFTGLIGTSLVAVLCTFATACGAVPAQFSEQPISSTESNLFGMNQLYWTPGAIRACWEGNLPSSSTAYYVRDAVERSWETVANVHFYGWDVCESPNATTAAMHIQIDDTNPRTVAFGTQNATLRPGMHLDNTFVSFSPGCQSESEFCQRAIATHEFGHALGFRHEQDRPETDSTPADENLCASTGYANPAPYNGTDATEYGAWDGNSVMNYCNPNWNNNGMLSTEDVAGVVSLYGTYLNKFLLHTATGVGGYLSQANPIFSADMDGDQKDDFVFLNLASTASGKIEINALSGASNYQNFIYRMPVPNETQTSDQVHYAYGIADVDSDSKADYIRFFQLTTSPNVIVQARSNSSGFATIILNNTTSMPSVPGSTIVVGHTSFAEGGNTYPTACQVRTSGSNYAARCFDRTPKPPFSPAYTSYTDWGTLPISTSTSCNWFLEGRTLVCMTYGTLPSQRTEAWMIPQPSPGQPATLLSTMPLPVGPSNPNGYRYFPTVYGAPNGARPNYNVFYNIGIARTAATGSGTTEFHVIDAGQIF